MWMTTRQRKERSLILRGNRRIALMTCRFCHTECEWWLTPKGKLVPLTSIDLEPHWDICKWAFRNERPVLPERVEPARARW